MCCSTRAGWARCRCHEIALLLDCVAQTVGRIPDSSKCRRSTIDLGPYHPIWRTPFYVRGTRLSISMYLMRRSSAIGRTGTMLCLQGQPLDGMTAPKYRADIALRFDTLRPRSAAPPLSPRAGWNSVIIRRVVRFIATAMLSAVAVSIVIWATLALWFDGPSYLPFDDLRARSNITARAAAAGDSTVFSARIRGLPDPP